MAVKGQAQQTLIDMTDAYSIILTSEAYTFPGTTNAAKPGSCTTQVLAFRGSEQVACSIGAITVPPGVSVSKNSDVTAPTLTITVSTSFTTAGEVNIPVLITGTDIVINKKFSISIAYTGATGPAGDTGAPGKGISSTEVTYQAGTSGTVAPTGTWGASIPSVSARQYLWTKTVTNYTDETKTTAYSVGMMGATGPTGPKGDTGATGNGISSTDIKYQAGTSGTTAPTGAWQATIPSVSASQYLWTRTIITYTNGDTDTSYSVGMMGATGPKGNTGNPGADAINISITSSNGLIFKNTDIATTLTAHVYKGGVELDSTQIAALGTVKWYKNGATSAESTGLTKTLSAGDVSNQVTYDVKLEG